jgi:hypothetical protein
VRKTKIHLLEYDAVKSFVPEDLGFTSLRKFGKLLLDYCSADFHLLFYPSSTLVRALSQFLLYIFLLSPAELAWSQAIKQCVNLTGVVQ